MRRIAALALLAALVAATSHHTAGFKLVVFPLSEKTHMLVALRLAAELVQRGHEVHVLTAECYQPFAGGLAGPRGNATAGDDSW